MDHDFQEALAYAHHLLGEHRRVHALLDRIEQQWARTPDELRQAETIADLRESVNRLRDEVAAHFAEEEAGGVLEEAASRHPELGREEMRLEDDHAALLGELDRILAGMQTATQVGVLPGDLKQAFKDFVHRLKAHEAAENRVIEQGFGIEIQ